MELNKIINPKFKNTAVREKNERIFFFNENWQWQSLERSDAWAAGVKGLYRDENGMIYVKTTADDLFKSRVKWFILQNALKSLVEGTSITELVSRIEKKDGWLKDCYTDWERVVQRIECPHIYRETGNKNTKTFDFIEVFVNLSSSLENQKDFIKTHRKELDRKVLERIENYKPFQRYGVPIQILTLKSLTLTKQSSVRYLFEVKHI